jgi:hypothetical protein
VVARILLWSLADSKTTLAELREHLPELPVGDVWISNEPAERFGLISFAETLPDVSPVVELIGSQPQVGEEFDVE